MRIRHLVLVVLGIAAVALAVQVAAPGAAQPTVLLDDGTINVSAGEDGRGDDRRVPVEADQADDGKAEERIDATAQSFG
jgi:hypothetical protein